MRPEIRFTPPRRARRPAGCLRQKAPKAEGMLTDGRLCNALNVIPQNLAMALGTTLAEALTTFAASGHAVL